jgi:hypothetical protein
VIHEALVATDKILLPSLRVKLEPVKQCVKASDHASYSWQHVCSVFPPMLSSKIEV